MSKEREDLANYLQQLPPGPVESVSELEKLLAAAWHTLSVDQNGGMEGYKLHNRMEEPVWQPPVLSFRIERHGAAAMGSTRAEIQLWDVNSADWTAKLTGSTRRQLEPMDKRLDTQKLAEQIASEILEHKDAPYLRWLSPNRVRLNIGVIIPETNKQTTSGRRKRFTNRLRQLLQPHGWHSVTRTAPHTYEKTSSVGESEARPPTRIAVTIH